MALRFSCKNVNIPIAGTAFTHSLGSTPDEWFVNLRGQGATGCGQFISMYVSAVSSTTITVSASGAAASGDVFANLNHSIIQ